MVGFPTVGQSRPRKENPMAIRNNHGSMQVEITKLIGGLESKLGDKSKLVVNGEQTSVAEIAKTLRETLSIIAAADKLKAQLRQLVQKQRTSLADARQLVLAIERYLQGTYGPRSEVLLEFGFSPLKTRGKSTRTKAQAAEKSQATREARHELGSRERKEIVAQPAPANGVPKGVVQNGAAA
jgi:hypothetical protein